MRIGIDARVLSSDKPTGIGVCVIEAVKRMCMYDSEIEYYLFSNEPILERYQFNSNIHRITITSKNGSLWVYNELTKALPKYQLDVFWGPLHLLPRKNKNLRKILTINDLALIINPSWGNRKNAVVQNSLVRYSVKHADKIITISEHTRKDIENILNVGKEKICVIYPGCTIGNEQKKTESLSDKLDINFKKVLESKYLLYVGTIEPRKNIINIVKAFNKLCEREKDYKLVLAGKLGWNYNPILKQIDKSKYKENIVLLGYIQDHQKRLLLENAKMFIFPSHYEGFGIPVAEAILAGLPVLTTRNSSLVEVAGDYQFYVENENDCDEILYQIIKILNCSKDELEFIKNKSIEHISGFSWDKFAEKIFRILSDTNIS